MKPIAKALPHSTLPCPETLEDPKVTPERLVLSQRHKAHSFPEPGPFKIKGVTETTHTPAALAHAPFLNREKLNKTPGSRRGP